MPRSVPFAPRLSVVLMLTLLAGLGCSPTPNDGAASQSGASASGCQTGWGLCDGACTDLTSNSAHCGGCGRSCGLEQTCIDSACRCSAGRSLCAGVCVDTLSNPAHCGGCNAPCAGVCSGGICDVGGSGGNAGSGTSGNGSAGASGNGGAGASGNASAGTSGNASAGTSGNASAGTSGNASAGTSGNASAGTSGDAGSGTSGNGGAGTSGSGGSSGDGIGGYIVNGSWHGFAWTATSPSGGTISPDDFGAVTDFPLCASGTVETGYDNVAMVGWNLNQEVADGEPALPVDPTLQGISVSVDNPGGSDLRLQIQGPSGDQEASDRWCAILPGTGGFIPYDAFNTECWAGGNGTPYTGQPIVAAIVLVPGGSSGPVSFDFCVTNLAETDEDGTAPGQGCSLSNGPGEGGGNISGSDTRTVTRDGRQYVVQNNVWNGDSNNQTLSVDGVSFEVIQQGNSSATNGAPTSYPSVFIGSNFGHSTSGSNLPRQVSSLASVQTGWRWSGAGGTYGAAYDVWFSTGAGGDSGTPSGGYLMVWFDHHNDIMPLGNQQGTESVGGKSWQVWICSSQTNGCSQNGVPVITYLPAGATFSEWSFDLNDFIQNAMDRYGVIQTNWYLTNVFAGFEIWNGGTGLRTDDFCAIVN